MRGYLPRGRRLHVLLTLTTALTLACGGPPPPPRSQVNPAAEAAWRSIPQETHEHPEGQAALKALAERWPDDLFAEQAIRALTREAAEPRALLPWLEARAEVRSASAPVARYCLAWLYHHRLEDPEAALDALSRFTHEAHTLYDDARWMKAGLLIARDDLDGARVALRWIFEARAGRGLLIGSLRSRLADDARLLWADLHGREGHWDEAIEGYASLIEDFEDSPLIEAARWGLARAASARGDVGEAARQLEHIRDGGGRLARRAAALTPGAPVPALELERPQDLRP